MQLTLKFSYADNLFEMVVVASQFKKKFDEKML